MSRTGDMFLERQEDEQAALYAYSEFCHERKERGLKHMDFTEWQEMKERETA